MYPTFAHRLQESPGNIRTRWIQNCVMISKRHILEPLLVHVLVKSTIPPVVTLKTAGPSQTPFGRPLLLSRVRRSSLAQPEQNFRRIVDIRIPVIGKFKGPPARHLRRVLHRPISSHLHFFGQKPVRTLGHSRSVRGYSSRRQCRHRNRGIPYRTQTGLNPKIAMVWIIHFQRFQVSRGLTHRRMIL